MSYLSAALAQEAAGWIAAQLLDEGVLIPEELVGAVLDHEWRAVSAGTNLDDRTALVAAIAEGLAADDIRVSAPPIPDGAATDTTAAPRPVPPEIVDRVLGWEDDFLGLAGIRRGVPAGEGG